MPLRPHPKEFSHDFGQSAVTENQLRERVRELKKADPAECRWDQDGKLKNAPRIQMALMLPMRNILTPQEY